MSKIDRFGLNTTEVAEYIPWGGIVRPHIIKQKNHSLLAVIEYKPFVLDLNIHELKEFTTWGFRRGWVIWAEHQQVEDKEGHDFLCICWNPFVSKTSRYVSNAMVAKLSKDKTIIYFSKQVQKILEDLKHFTEAKFLKYQELMDMLSFTLSHGMDRQELPEIPLYLDALLSNDIDFRFGDNNIYINKKKLYVVSFLAPEDVAPVYKLLPHITFRHTRRLLCFSDKEAGKDMKRYINGWFPNRKVIKEVALNGIIKRYNGYYMDVFQFALDENTEDFREFFQERLDNMGISYIVESYFIKEIFWGSIPGLYWANSKPPMIGFDFLTEFLTGGTIIEKNLKRDILEETENNLIPTSIDLNEYLHESARREVLNTGEES